MANFYSVLLTIVTLVAGAVWWYDARYKKPVRLQRIQAEEQRLQQQLDEEARARIAPQGRLAEFAQSVFPVLFVILILRSFIFEPFRIPSASMMPTMLAGDFILVQKFSYSLRDPIFRTELMKTGTPQRGDIAVFKYPGNPQLDYIKRIIGTPGDRIIYRNKTLYLEPACVEQSSECPQMQVIERDVTAQDEVYFSRSTPLVRYQEQLGNVTHEILIDPTIAPRTPYFYQQEGTAPDEWIVPEGHYFFMGDNRDNSEDSRYWGFVPEHYLVGRATFIWMSFEMDRSRNSWLPQWVPTGVRWHRLGTVE
ncbi:signal peptidase I [Pseudidiomarina sp. WS423]|uniref:signal peptidase I n=1 Tax=Pseudidiomarina sp. WS423 TaxID=3425124 RepID=UPI003D6FF374